MILSKKQPALKGLCCFRNLGLSLCLFLLTNILHAHGFLPATVKPQSDAQLIIDTKDFSIGERCVKVTWLSNLPMPSDEVVFQNTSVLVANAQAYCEVFWPASNVGNSRFYLISGNQSDSFTVTQHWQLNDSDFSTSSTWTDPQLKPVQSRSAFNKGDVPGALHVIRIGGQP